VLAIGIYSFDITGSAFVVASMLFCRTLPGVVFGALTGTLASRFRRKRVLLLGMSIGALNALVLVTLAWVDQLNLFVIGAGAVIAGTIWTLEHPVRRTLLGDVAEASMLRQAMSLDQFTVNGTRLLGPLVGGAAYAALGMIGVYSLSLAGFTLAVLLVYSTTANPGRVASAGESFRASLLHGLRYIRTQRILRGVLLFTIVANFFGFSYVTMVPVVGRELLQLNPEGVGLLQAMEGAGAVLAAIVLATTTRTVRFARSFALGGLLFLFMLIPFALSPWFLPSAVALFLAGIGIGCFGAMQSTTLLNASDPAQRMRVMGVLVMCIGAAPAGVLVTGALADWYGASAALLSMALGGLIASLICLFRYPELLR
jgi:MFS family permease